ncbi:MAG: precorrin-2 C(20)-methyltransferase [Anaerovoracaceae bacterium]
MCKPGKLYGLGVGPGDPELMTLKSVRLIKECDVIVIPCSGQSVNAAYTIALGAVPEIKEKNIVEVDMPMIRDKAKLEQCHDKATEEIIKYLKNGKLVAFLTLGDPSIYSTYIYVHDRILAKGYDAELVPGIPSFCAVAARLNEGLTEASQPLHIIPSSYKGLEDGLGLKGTKVLMKSGKSIGKIKKMIMEDPSVTGKMVQRCGMDGEQVFHHAKDISEDASYFSIIVVKDK